MSILAKVKFGWSLVDFCRSYNFFQENHVFGFNILRFNVSFEKINLAISPSVFTGTTNTGHKNTDTVYFSFQPLGNTMTGGGQDRGL
jgi:hypothetical protein